MGFSFAVFCQQLHQFAADQDTEPPRVNYRIRVGRFKDVFVPLGVGLEATPEVVRFTLLKHDCFALKRVNTCML